MTTKQINSMDAYRNITDPELRHKYQSEEIDREINSPYFDADEGLFLESEVEALPVFGPVGKIEKVISRTGTAARPKGARIVLTKDNCGHRGTGLGGVGGMKCEAIDLVAGQLTCERGINRKNIRSRGSFPSDGARIYLTERGDIQHYFALGEASKAVSVSSDLKSGVGIKADHTLIIGRELVRITAGFGNATGTPRLANWNENVTPKIEIASVNDSEAQPAVMGDNLVDYLDDLAQQINSLTQKTQILEQKIIQHRMALALHFHSGAGIGYIQTFPDPVLASQAAQTIPEFMNTTRKNLIDTFNSSISKIEARGTEDLAVQGTASKSLLSKTVYIGR